jgi:hypothetical protein
MFITLIFFIDWILGYATEEGFFICLLYKN